jgi:transposase
MGAPYSQDLRDRVLAAYDAGKRTGAIAESFQVSPAWARRVKQRRREFGETRPRPMGGATVIKIDLARLAELVRTTPDATLLELRAALGVKCSAAAVCLALKRLGLTFKKRRSMPLNRPVRMSRGAGGPGVGGNRRSMRND